MTQDINGQLEQAVLSSIKQGRWLAEEWEEIGIYPGKRLQALLPQLDVSRFRAAPVAHLSDLSFEGQGAFPAQC